MTNYNIKNAEGDIVFTFSDRKPFVFEGYRFPRRDYSKGLQCAPLEDRGFTVEEIPRPEPVAIPPQASEVKAEAGRRIESVFPDYKQRNAMALALQGIRDHGTDPSVWPEPMKSMHKRDNALWEWTKAVRARSDDIEKMKPIPQDFRDDTFWPEAPE
jgi:hypothetical protein